jgi:small-conductance mechanosensitive channel
MLPHAAGADSSGPTVVAIVLAVAAALVVALVLGEVVGALLRRAGRRRWLPAHLSGALRIPVAALLGVVSFWWALALVSEELPAWFPPAERVAAVAALTWVLAVALPAATDAALDRHRIDVPGRRHARGSAAVARAARGVVRGVVVLAGLATGLLAVDATRVAGLVALGVLVITVAVLCAAALPWLRDVAAGLELALTDAVRLDDVLAVDGEWGRVEEITATSVLLQVWDDRRVLVPARRLTAEPFENWTRRTADLVGHVDVDIDGRIPVTRVRAELVRLVEANDLWDRRVAVLQVVEATAGRVRVRAVVSAADAPRLMDLRCDVREALVEWLRGQVPTSAPLVDVPVRSRHTADDEATTTGSGPDRTVRVDPRRDARLFTGSVFAVERSQAFTGPGPDVLAERDAAAEG